MANKKIWEFPENTNPQPDLVFLVDENFTTQKISLSAVTEYVQNNTPVPTSINSGPTAPGTAVVANETDVDINFSGVGTAWSFSPTGLTFPDNTIQTTAYTGVTQGPQGPQGVSGATGPQGPQGVSGATGPQGPAGSSGISPTIGSWTLSTGPNTVSFTVTGGSQSYVMWVNGNIPNGIVNWNATVTLSNPNVPAIGVQYGWYYLGNQLVLTSMPNQIVGVAGGISTTSYTGSTSNVFTFGITNNSLLSQTVYYGYIRIS